MASGDANDSQALTGGDTTKYRALVARISYVSQDRPDPKFAAMQVCCAVANPLASDVEWVKRIGRYISWRSREQSACSTGSRAVNLKRSRTQIGEATK